MKGVVEEFFDKVGLHKKEKYDPNAGKSFLHPGRQANIIYDGVVVGYLGEVHPEVADNYGIGTRAYIAVIDMPEIVARATFDRKYTGIAKFPAVTRDISMVMPKEILVGQIEDVIERAANIWKVIPCLIFTKERRSRLDSNPLHILSYSVQRIRLWKMQMYLQLWTVS